MKKEFNIYFFNGFSKPELVATSIEELVSDIELFDNYLGDVTEELIDELKYVNWNNIEDVNSVLYYYDMVANPTTEVLIDEFMLKWFNKSNFAYELLEDFGSKQDIYNILNNH